jgi:hypothetical protein
MDNNTNSFTTTSPSFDMRGFLESNSLIAKFVFLLLIIFIFVISLRIGIILITYLLQPKKSPKIINGMVDASQQLTISQDPTIPSSITIYRSDNAKSGVEFTWSVWIFINYKATAATYSTKYQHIFSKGNGNVADGTGSSVNSNNGIIFPNNAPGLYISPITNNMCNLTVFMNTYDASTIQDQIEVSDVPLNKWVNVILRCTNNVLDVYVNGVISRSITLSAVPKQNYGDVNVAMNGGFDGYISNLWYYNYALGTREIQQITQSGPNTTMVGNITGMSDPNYNYLSLKWFFNNNTNAIGGNTSGY